MRLPLKEIRQNAIRFAHEWAGATSEQAEAQSFWNDFFEVFGLKRRSIASFEKKVKNLKGRFDRIDVLWSGVMIGEHKSRGQSLAKAATQALDYCDSLLREGRGDGDEVPRYIVVSDFARFAVHDLEAEPGKTEMVEVALDKLHEKIRAFDFISGYKSRKVDPEDPINVRAVVKLGKLHDQLERAGYKGHRLEQFMVRILFCLFAEDTGIFDPDTFKSWVMDTREDGSDLGPQLARFFAVLDEKPEDRNANLAEGLAGLPYVNGRLFAESLKFADFDRGMRDALVECCEFQWAAISPAVFGSLFQSIMTGEEGHARRRQGGAHYTTERDIMKLVRSLFLDDLREEFERVKANKTRLAAFHDKLAGSRFFDPACGCGNFLVIAYRELRLLEIDILKALQGEKTVQRVIHIDALLKLNVDQMYGIEIEEWPARIAEVAMWLVDHQMNQKVSEVFGEPVLRLPLTRSAHITHGNALRIDWNDVLAARDCSYLLGNPPFVGKAFMTEAQNADVEHVAGKLKGRGVLDYVTMWYLKAADYIDGTDCRAAFVSSNSITQGEQVGIIWPELWRRKVKINFGHRTFVWRSDARDPAHVHVVIIGFWKTDAAKKWIIDYEGSGDGAATLASNINPYLIDHRDLVIQARSSPLNGAPAIVFGSMPNDGGHLLLDDDEKADLLAKEPGAAKFIRRLYGSKEFINEIPRWCLWLKDATPGDLKTLPEVLKRVALVKKHREESDRATTQELAGTPSLFGEDRQPHSEYLLIPSASSINRDYIPMAFQPAEVIASNLVMMVPGASMYHFGVLTSRIHMGWVRTVCGRLKSDYRYSNRLVYNNFPWPEGVTKAQRNAVEEKAQAVLAARAAVGGQTYSDLYDPLTMPRGLVDAHKKLDLAVERCYRKARFKSERERVEFLFDRYEAITNLFAPTAKRKRMKKVQAGS